MSKYPFLPSGETDEIGSSAEPWKKIYGENIYGENIYGNTFSGKASTAGTADTARACSGNSATATKATQDRNGNDIPSTYATKNEALVGYSLVNGVPSFTYTV